MTVSRRLRIAQAVLISALLVVGTSTTALAANADVRVGGGIAPGTYNRSVTPPFVSTGKVAGFYLWAQNADTANLSTFFLTAQTDATLVGAYWWVPSADPSVTPDYNPCGTMNGALDCEFGTFGSGATVQVLAAYTMTKSSTANCGPSGSYTPGQGVAAQCVHFQWGSHSGFVPDKKNHGNNSRGDAFDFYDYASFISSADEAAGFPFCNKGVLGACDSSSLLSIADQATSRTNLQSTKVTAPRQALNSSYSTSALHVADNVAFDCAGLTGLSECSLADIGQWSQIDVNSGQEFPDSWVEIEVGIYGTNANQISVVYHFWLDASNVWQVETLSACSSVSDPAPGGATACFVASGHGQQATVIFWTHHNGFGKFG